MQDTGKVLVASLPLLNTVSEATMQESGAMAKYVAEFIGTFFLVFTIGCSVHTGSIGAAVAIGMMLMVMIYALGSVSGAHFNPAVTLSVLLAGRGKINATHAVFYMVFQVAGAIIAAVLYWKLTSQAFILAPVSMYSVGNVIAVEVAYTTALCYVVLNVATTEGPKGNGSNNFFGLAIGAVVLSAAIVVGPISGCSLNPAVSVGSFAASYLAHGAAALYHWEPYVFAPFVGAALAAMLFYMARGKYEYNIAETATKTKSVTDFVPKQVPVQAAKPPARPPVVHRSGSRILRRHDSVALHLLDSDCLTHDLYCGLRWLTTEDTLDVDASCVKFNKQGNCLGAIYFACQEDKVNQIKHSGDQVVGDIIESKKVRKSEDHDNERISFKLSGIKEDVHFLFFVANIFSSGAHSFKDVRECAVRLVDTDSDNRELLRFEKKDIGTGNALVISMLFRMNDTWYFKAIDESYQIQEHGTYRALEPQLQRFCLQTQETMSPEALYREGP